MSNDELFPGSDETIQGSDPQPVVEIPVQDAPTVAPEPVAIPAPVEEPSDWKDVPVAPSVQGFSEDNGGSFAKDDRQEGEPDVQYGSGCCSAPADPYLDIGYVRALRRTFEAGTSFVEEGKEIRYLEGVPIIFEKDDDGGWGHSTLSELLPAPNRQTGSIGNFTEHTSFAKHFVEQANPASRIYFNPLSNPVSAMAVFDENPNADNPRWRQQYSTLSLKLDDEWREWVALIGRKEGISQRDLGEFLEDHAKTISNTYRDHIIETTKFFTAYKAVNFVSSTNLENGDTQFTYEDQTTTAGVGKAGTVEVPRTFVIELKVFKGGAVYPLTCTLRHRITGEGIKFFVKIPSIQKALDDAVKEIISDIESQTSSTVFIGTA